MTRSETVAADIIALLRARNPMLWVVTREELRAERYIFEAAAKANYICRTWDVAQGVADIGGIIDPNIGGKDPGETLDAIKSRAMGVGNERGVWILRDLPSWLQVAQGGAPTLRALKNLARLLPGTPRESAQALVVLSPSSEVPAEIANLATVIEWPLPDREEIAAILDAAIESLPDDMRDKAAPNGQRDAAIDAAVGLSGDEAQACYAKSLVQLRRIDPVAVAKEKKRVITASGVLEYFDPLPGGLGSVGGLENLKAWLVARRSAYTPEARAYGLPSPKGCLLVGIPGCGKSLTAKAIATAWGVPLIKFDLGALKSKFVGESEQNLRKAFRTIEAVGRCVVWLDEIEKALQGATSGSADGGVSSDALGAVLSWMQERQGEAFVIATANDAELLPPELLRKGRFDEIWWIDLPTQKEREEILSASLYKHDRDGSNAYVATVAAACQDFTGSEIAAIVPEAMFAAFADNAREINSEDLIAAAATVVPLARTAKEKIARLRLWAEGRARPATRAEDVKAAPVKKGLRVLDM